MSKLWRFTITAALSGSIASVQAAGTHSLAEIAGTAAMALHARAEDSGYRDLEVEVRPLDARLQLAQCDQPLQTLPETTGRALGPVSVGIRCNGTESWTLYVRGTVSARVEMPVLAASLGRGDLVTESDLTTQTKLINNDLVGFITNRDDIIGKEVKRPLVAGSELRFSDLKAPTLVERGQQVDIVSAIAGLRVSMQGKALSNGGAGDRVLVSNTQTGRRLEGVVSGDGTVLIQ